jgi:hypothetical protein
MVVLPADINPTVAESLVQCLDRTVVLEVGDLAGAFLWPGLSFGFGAGQLVAAFVHGLC